jgi:ADP-ribose pyrophosphatase YjhB (NUDIX family)
MVDKRNLDRAVLLQSMAQTGLTFSKDPHDISRYQKIRAIAAEMVSDSGVNSPKEIEDIFKLESGYATPKVDVRAAVFREDQILLVRERSDGCWTLPGGWADVGDTPAESVIREVYEESGFKTRASRVLALFDRKKHGHPASLFHIYKIFFLCEIIGGNARPSDETSEVGFFGEEELPEISSQRATPGQIRTMFEHYRNPGRGVDFD